VENVCQFVGRRKFENTGTESAVGVFRAELPQHGVIAVIIADAFAFKTLVSKTALFVLFCVGAAILFVLGTSSHFTRFARDFALAVDALLERAAGFPLTARAFFIRGFVAFAIFTFWGETFDAVTEVATFAGRTFSPMPCFIAIFRLRFALRAGAFGWIDLLAFTTDTFVTTGAVGFAFSFGVASAIVALLFIGAIGFACVERIASTLVTLLIFFAVGCALILFYALPFVALVCACAVGFAGVDWVADVFVAFLIVPAFAF